MPTLLERTNALQAHDQLPKVLIIPEMVEDAEASMAAERIFRSVGATALKHEIESQASQLPESRFPTFLDALRAAKLGDEQASAYVGLTVKTDWLERVIKTGNIMKVPVESDAQAVMSQHGQTFDDINRNTLRFTSRSSQMFGRTQAETRNGSRAQLFNRLGYFKAGYVMIVMSRRDDQMTVAEATKAGFFTDTDTLIFQATTDDGIEAGFVAGRTKEGEQIDKTGVEHVARQLGADYMGMTTTQILDTPLLVHRSLMPNGVIDLVKIYDEAHGTFFGERRAAQDYNVFLKDCERREANYDQVIAKIVERLLAGVDDLQTPAQASDLLDRIAHDAAYDRTFTDHSIDARVFGTGAMSIIEEGRRLLAIGDIDGFLEKREQGKQVATSFSCPKDRTENAEKESSQNCDLETTCPFCSHLKQDGTRSAAPIKVSAYIDKSKTIHCRRCQASANSRGSKPGIIRAKTDKIATIKKVGLVARNASDQAPV